MSAGVTAATFNSPRFDLQTARIRGLAREQDALLLPVRRGWQWDRHLPQPDSSEKLHELQEAHAAVTRGANSSSGAYELTDELTQSTAVVDGAWVPFNESQLTPLLPREIVWLLEDAQDRLRNRSNLPLQLELARTLARYTSIVYCQEPNIHAWNCSR